jgi:hypothetical protein
MADFAFDWDDANVDHIARHGVTPLEIEQVFANQAVDIDFDVVDGEDRWTRLGTPRDYESWWSSGPCGTNPFGRSLLSKQGEVWYTSI